MSKEARKKWWDDQGLWGVGGSLASLGLVYGLERAIDAWVGRDSGLDYLYLLPLWVAVSLGGRRAGWVSAALTAFVVSSLHEDGSFLEPRRFAAFGVNLLALLVVAALFDTFGRSLARARSAASTDPLTCIANRRAGYSAGRAMVHAANQAGGRVAVVTMDCNGFKQINDVHGHASGDEALKVVARALSQSVRATDKVFRLGGDEFVMVLADAGSLEAEVCLGRVRSQLERASEVLGFDLRVSSGCAVAARDGATFDELLRTADTRLYRQKRLARSFDAKPEGEVPTTA